MASAPRAIALLALPFVLLALALPATASAATTRTEAAKLAVAAAAPKGAAPFVAFGERAPIAAGTVITESALVLPNPDASRARTKPRFTGVRTGKARRAALARESSWLFWVDLAPDTQQGHASKVVLVGVRSGRVTVSTTLRFAPLVDGVLPTFLRTTTAYNSKAVRVAERLRTASAAPSTAAPVALAGSSVDRLAGLLGAQRTCVVLFGETFGTSGEVAGVKRSLAAVQSFYEQLGKRDAGIVVRRYTLASGRTPTAYLAQVVRDSSCGQAVVYVAGASSATGQPMVVLGSQATSGGLRLQELLARRLRDTIHTYPGTQFSVVMDVSHAAGFHAVLANESNVAAFLAPGGDSFTAVPKLRVGSRIVGNSGNPQQLLEFTNDLLRGMATFANSDTEVLHAGEQPTTAGAPGVASWMLGRGIDTTTSFVGAVGGGSHPIVDLDEETTEPGPNAGNHAPIATAATVTVAEDGTAALTLAGTDQDGDALTAALVSGPSHGALTGTGAARTYTPVANFHGTDTLTFTVADARGGMSAPATVTITVTSVDDAPVAANDVLVAHEDAGATLAAPGLLANDSDADGDALVLDRRDGSATLGGSTGAGATVTLAADGSVAYATNAMFDALRAGQTATDSFTYRVTAGGVSSTATTNVTITGANDVPTALARTAVSVAENQPSGTAAGVLSTTDVDAGDTHTYSLVSGTGSTDNASFQVVGSALQTAGSLDFEASVTRSVRVRTTDAAGAFVEQAFTVTVTDAEEAPTLTLDAGPVAATEQTAPVALSPGTTVTDVDDANLESATVRISAAFQAADELVFVDQGNITGAYDSAAGVLTLTGSDTTAAWQTALRSVAYRHTGDAPSASKTVEFVVNDGSLDSAADTIDVAVTAVDDTPTALGFAGASVAENVALGTDVSTLSTTDPDAGDTFTYTLVAGTGSTDNGSFAIAGNKLRTNATLDRETKSSYTVRVRTTDSGGLFTEDVLAISVTNVNEAPTAIGLAPATIRDTAAIGDTVGALTATDQDAGDTFTFSLVAGDGTNDADNASYSIVGGSLKVAAPLTGGTDSIRVRVTDAAGLTFEATKLITVTTNSAPTDITLSSTTIAEGGANRVVGTLSATDADAGDTFTYSIVGGADAAKFGVPNALRTAGIIDFEADSSLDITIRVTDNHGATFDKAFVITVTDVNEPPTDVTLDSTDVDENDGANAVVGTLGHVDQDATGTYTYTLVAGTGSTDNGSFNIAGTNLRANASLDFETKSSYSVRIQVSDGTYAFPRAFTITVNDVDEPPVVATTAAALAYTENAAATPIDPAITITDPEGLDLAGATAEITGGLAAGDALSWTDTDAGDGIGLDPASTSAKVVLSGLASTSAYQAALRAVTYENTSDDPLTTARTVTFTAIAASGPAGAGTRSIAITAVDDAPVAVDDVPATLNEDDPATTVAVLANDTDIDAGPKSVASVVQPAHGVVVNNGTGVTYAPAANYCGVDSFTYTLNGGSSANVTMSITCVNDAPVADDETFNGSSSAVGNTTLAVNAPGDGVMATPDPTDTAPVTDRPHKTITGDILAGDTDIDGPGPLTLVPGTFATFDGGTVTVETDGDFTFEPAPGTSCTDTSDFFDYTVLDNDPGTPLSDTGRVTVAITGCVWYVNNNDAQGNSGTSQKPFDTLAQAEAASTTGQTVFVYDGDNTTTGYTAGFSLKASQKLIGEAADLVIGSDTLHGADAANKPSLTDTNADVIDLDDANTVKGFNLDPSGTGGGIGGASGDTGGGTIDDVNIVDAGSNASQPGLELTSVTGTWNISNLVVSMGSAKAVSVTSTFGAATVNFLAAGTIDLTSFSNEALEALDTNLGNSTFDSLTVSSSGVGGIVMQNVTGTTSLGDGVGTDVNVTSSPSSTPELVKLSNAGTVTIPGSGTSSITSTGGPAIDINSGTTGNWDIDTLNATDTTSSPSFIDAVNLALTGASTFRAASGTISSVNGIGLDLSGGSGDVTFGGSFANGGGSLAISVAARTGGIVTLSGNINDTNDAGGAINVSSNSGGQTILSGATKKIDMGTNTGPAISFSGSDGHTLTLSNGGLDIDTTSGTGLNAITSGTLQVSGSGNTIDSTALTAGNRGLNIADTDISSNDVTFDHVSTSGGLNGIRLLNTGTAGNLNVTGTGGTCTAAVQTGCTGGRIQNASGAGIELTNVGPQATSLTRVAIASGLDDGIRGSSVGGLDLLNSWIGNNGNAAGENGLDFTELTGTVNLTATTVANSAEDNVSIVNDSGALNLSVSGSTIVGTNGVTGDDGLSVRGTGTGSQTVDVQNTTFTSNIGDHVHVTTDSSNTVAQNVTVNNATMTGAASGFGSGILLDPGGNADVNAFVTNTNIQGARGSAVMIDTQGTTAFPQATHVDATITGNTIGTAGTAGSGALNGDDVTIMSNGGATMNALVSGNTLTQYVDDGIYLLQGDGSGALNASVRSNTIASPATGASWGIYAQTGLTASDAGSSCFDIGGAGPLANAVSGGAANGVDDIRLRTSNSTTMSLAAYAGAPTDSAAVGTYLRARNTTTLASASYVSGPGFASVASCTLPS